MCRQKPNSHKVKSGVVLSLVFSLFVVGLALFLVLNRQFLYDEAIFMTYKPTSEVSDIESRLDLNSYGDFLLRASQPKVENSQSFNTDCNKTETTAAILGCYSNNRIYIYNVTESKLDGIKEVTAAHEMLHAAYERLSSNDKTKVNSLVEAEYQKIKDDSDIKAVTEYYSKAEPGQLDNELHSIIGTQISSISPELEAYYSKYFINRQAVVQMYQKYINVFKALNSQASDLAAQIKTLKSSIEDSITRYNSDVALLKNDIADFNSRASNNDFASMSEFYAERAVLSSRISSLNITQTEINDNIKSYNSLIEQYNSIASESQKLQNSLNSSLSSTPSV